LDKARGTDIMATKIARPMTSWILFLWFRQGQRIQTNDTVLARTTRLALRRGCSSQCSNAIANMGEISAPPKPVFIKLWSAAVRRRFRKKHCKKTVSDTERMKNTPVHVCWNCLCWLSFNRN
jgi:hypothetical protein